MKRHILTLLGLTVSMRLLACGGYFDTGFTAHEWGTFTSVQGADGVQLEWNPFTRTDLPEFVYDRADLGRTGWKLTDYVTKFTIPTMIRMETPVIYFYSAEARTADVRVSFPQGRITEWYPQATGLGPYVTANAQEKARSAASFIEWKGVKILPKETKECSGAHLIREKGENHYYAARETGANFIRMDAPGARANGPEYDRLLFYRGVGSFRAPLTTRLENGGQELTLATTNAEPIKDLFVLTIRNGEAWFRYMPEVKRGEPLSVPLNAGAFHPLSDVRPRLMAAMKDTLIRHHLYAAEAEAMVNTWKDQWFAEEGTRVLYLLPAQWTDRTLPLEVKPAPAQTVRVMVGRSEMLVPEKEQELSRQITRYMKADRATEQQVVARVRELNLGRFLEPAIRRALGSNPDKALSKAAWSLAQAAADSADKKAVADTTLEKPAEQPKRAEAARQHVAKR